jgi:DNA-binding transcriptional LysR family regulator
MDIRQLKVIETVCKTGSVTETARILNVSQPAISKTVKQVEEETGLVLFEKIQGRIFPTAQAGALLPVVERLMSSHDDVKERIRELRTGRRGLIKVATAPSLTSTLLAEAIKRFRQKRAHVELRVFVASTKEVVDRVARNEVDIGTCQPSSGDSEVSARPMAVGNVICVMPGGHRLAHRKSIAPQDLVEEEIITFPEHEPTGARISEAFVNAGVRLRRAIEINQSYGGCSFASLGLGVALVDSFIHARGHFPTLAVRPFAPEIRVRTHMLVSSVRSISPLAKEFSEMLLQVGKDYQHPAL